MNRKAQGGGGVDYGNYNVGSDALHGALSQFANNNNLNIIVTSGDRSAARNRAAGGANASRHLFGDAADIKVNGISNKQLSYLANQSGLFNTVIYYPSIDMPGALRPHVHVDLNPSHNNSLLMYTPYMQNGYIRNSYSPMTNPLIINRP